MSVVNALDQHVEHRDVLRLQQSTRSFIEHTLSATTHEHLRNALQTLAYPQGTDYEAYLTQARGIVGTVLPNDILQTLASLRYDPCPPAAVFIRNFPIDDPLPATPTNSRRSLDKRTSISESVLCGMAYMLGEPVSFEVEKDTLVHDVCPVQGTEHNQTNTGSLTELGFHTELAFFTPGIRWVALLGLRPDHDRAASTPIADVRAALPLVSPQDLAILQQPQFRMRVPFIFDPAFPPEQRFSEPRPVLTGSLTHPEIRCALYGHVTRPLSEDAERALHALTQAVATVAHPTRLDAGEMVIISNYVAFHARSVFTPRYDAEERWLQRLNSADSLWQFRTRQQHSLRLLSN